MHVSLTTELERLVREKVESGYYSNASEVIRDALRMMVQRDHAQNAELAMIREAVAPAIEEAERGDTVDFDPRAIVAQADAKR